MINQVPIQPSEWHRSMQLPQAWTSFMDRCFMAVVQVIFILKINNLHFTFYEVFMLII